MAKKVVQQEAKKVILTDSEGNYIVPFIDPADKGGGGLEIGDIGIAPLGIDETKGKRRYLNGQLIIQEPYQSFTAKLKEAVALYPTLACTESEWQTTATMTVGGQVGKFVVDDEAGTIRLPRIIMPIQGLTDLSKLGEIVEAGLPDVWFTYGSLGNEYLWQLSSGFSRGDYSNGRVTTTSKSTNNTLTFKMSRQNPIYKENFDKVQQEAIQYPYFIQVATGSETVDNIVNEIELNNPFSLLDYKFSEYELNNLSWLRSNSQYNPKAIYPAVYDLLLKIYNATETKAGVSVKLWTDESATDYDFRINTAEETFRLPVKVKLASGKAVVGNGIALGFTNGTDNFSLTHDTYAMNPSEGYGANVGSTVAYFTDSSAGTVSGITTDPTKSGIETSDSDLYLYFYVGETVQNANLINAGRIEEIKANRTEVDGEWVNVTNYFTIAQNITSEVQVDISSLIPKDGYVYELIINVTLVSTTYSQIAINGGVINTQYVGYAHALSTGKSATISNSVVVPINTNRIITVFGDSSANSNAFNIVGYRRLGNGV